MDVDDEITAICQGCDLLVCNTCIGGFCPPQCQPSTGGSTSSVQPAVDKLKELRQPNYDPTLYPHKCQCGHACYDDGFTRLRCTNPLCAHFDPELQ